MSGDGLHPGFIVLQSNRLEDLRSVTLQWLARQPLGPMEADCVLVQSNGVGQWLKTAMAQAPAAGGLGIAFGVQLMLPARFQWLAYRAVLEAVDGLPLPETSVFDKSRLRWRLMARLPALLEAAEFAPLRAFLAEDSAGDQRRRWQLAERLADLYDQYQVYRADWLQAWSAGEDVLVSADGRRQALDAEQRWQAVLWRDLEASVPAPARAAHRAAIHARFLTAAATLTPSSCPPALPRRLLVFGISALPQQTLQTLAALAGAMQVLVCMVNPCRHYWGDIIEHRELLRGAYRRQARRAGMPPDLDLTALHAHAQPLLAAWGKQGRDALHLVDVHDQTEHHAAHFERAGLAIDLFAEPGADTLLHQLQSDVLELRPLAETRALWPPVNAVRDRSISFHVAHGAQREVEVLHDQLLDAFERDPTLRPGDVIVMVPDVNAFAAHIHAVFGQFERADPRHIPYQVADQLQRHRAPLLVALEQVLGLPRLRLRVSEVLGLLEVPAIRARFDIDAAELPTLRRWCAEANIRWGLDGAHRAELGLPGTDDMHSWRFGLRRMLYGYAMGGVDAEQTLADGIVPYAEVAGLDAVLVGRLARLVETLAAQRTALLGNLAPDAWAERLQALLEAFFRATSAAEDGLLGQLTEALESWLTQCAEADFADPLPLGVVSESWLGLIDEEGLTQRFGGGAVTFATLLPMRAVPFRQVCLLGMNDADYPRRASRPDFDLMALAEQYRPGDRSRREDDRYLFLEAILAARDALYVSWSGRSQRDNSEVPASVLVGQLRDHLASGWTLHGAGERAAGGQGLLTALTTEYPLQPFARAYFTARAAPDRLFTYASEWAGLHADADADADAVAGDGADDGDGESDEGPAAARRGAPPLPPWTPDAPLRLRQLSDFLRNPVRELFRQRLRSYFPDAAADECDDEPFAIAPGLERWLAQDALLQPVGRRLDRDPGSAASQRLAALRERLRQAGTYPQGCLGELVGDELSAELETALRDYAAQRERYPCVLDPAPEVTLQVAVAATGSSAEDSAEVGALHLDDVLDRLCSAADGTLARLVLETSRALDAQGRPLPGVVLRHWPAHLALQLQQAGSATLVVSPTGTATLPGLGAAEARALLEDLMRAWHDGMRAVLPITADLAFAVLTALGDVDVADARVDLTRAAGEQAVRHRFEQACAPGSAFARECDSLDALLGGAAGEAVRTALAQFYQPFSRHLLAAPAAEAGA